ncbi:MAG: Rrf2 family transcriptional regulator [Bryobacterales bacterium]|nr:Rrf2 family transcriptional regulator [Bryobacterales bacterium]
MFSATSQYALRAMTLLASRYRSAPMLGREIARETGIPSNYLSKILAGLNKAGLVDATRGTGGGYMLTVSPESLTLDRIVAVFDRDMVNPCCLLGYSRPCSDENACTAHFVWKDTRQQLVNFLENTTLAEISQGRPGQKNAFLPNPALLMPE